MVVILPVLSLMALPRYTDPGSHDPKEHSEVDPSGKEIKRTKTEDKEYSISKSKEDALGFIAREFSQFKILI